MSTADDIKARVRAADAARASGRADRAAAVADAYAQREAVLAKLEEIEGELTGSIRAATEVMSVDELAEFTQIGRAKLAVRRRPPATAVRARSVKTRGRPAKTKTPGAPEAIAGAEPEPASSPAA